MSNKSGTLLAAILGSGIVFLDSTVVNVALQRIGQDLPSSFFGVLEGQSYVYNAYLLSLSSLLILAGALAEPADGALIIFRGDDSAAATSFAQKDPYVCNGLVKHWEVRPWTVVVGGEDSSPSKAAQGDS